MLKINEKSPEEYSEIRDGIAKVKHKRHVFELANVPYDGDARKPRPQKRYILPNHFVRTGKNNERQVVTYYEYTKPDKDGNLQYVADDGFPKIIFERARKVVNGETQPDLVWFLQNSPDYNRVYTEFDKMATARSKASKAQQEYEVQKMILDEREGLAPSVLISIAQSYGETGVEEMDIDDVVALLIEKVELHGAKDFLEKVDSPIRRYLVDVNRALEEEVIRYNSSYRTFSWYDPEKREQAIIKQVPAGIPEPIQWFSNWLAQNAPDTLEEMKSRLVRTLHKKQQNRSEAKKEPQEPESTKDESPREKEDAKEQAKTLTFELKKLMKEAERLEKQEEFEQAKDKYTEALEINIGENRTAKQEDLYEDAQEGLKRCEGNLAEA